LYERWLAKICSIEQQDTIKKRMGENGEEM